MSTVDELRDEMRKLVATVDRVVASLGAAARARGPAIAGPPPPVIALSVDPLFYPLPGRLVQLPSDIGQRSMPRTELIRPSALT